MRRLLIIIFKLASLLILTNILFGLLLAFRRMRFARLQHFIIYGFSDHELMSLEIWWSHAYAHPFEWRIMFGTVAHGYTFYLAWHVICEAISYSVCLSYDTWNLYASTFSMEIKLSKHIENTIFFHRHLQARSSAATFDAAAPVNSCNGNNSSGALSTNAWCLAVFFIIRWMLSYDANECNEIASAGFMT